MGAMSRPFGRLGFSVPSLGLGAIGLGDAALPEAEAKALLHRALDLGLNLVDAAPSYGEAEVRIGRHLGGRRDVLRSTKVGYGVDGVPDWTGPCITAGVEQALRRFQADVLDIVHLHSCPASLLRDGEVVEALVRAREAGKIRAAAYSGDGPDLEVAVELGSFDAVQASFNLCDRANLRALEAAKHRGLGRLGKRSLANAAWTGRPSGGADVYPERWSGLDLPVDPERAASWALRYAVFHAPTDGALVGTRSLARLEQAVRAVEAGPLDSETVETIEARWSRSGTGWPAVI